MHIITISTRMFFDNNNVEINDGQAFEKSKTDFFNFHFSTGWYCRMIIKTSFIFNVKN